jgi:heme/copper-type cytochrome/quinol oxidase subunit 3
MSVQEQHLDALQDIRRMMKRSSRFISLSGLSGIAAGLWALIGAYIAKSWISEYYRQYDEQGYTGQVFQQLKINLFMLAAVVLLVSLLSAFYFTWRRAGKNNLPLWDHTSRLLVINMAIPLVTGGLFILAMLQHNQWSFIAPACLVFYGLALVNGSKYTLSDIRYLGILEIVLGLINTQMPGNGLYFWAVGFGILHIIYGFVMWWKNERLPETAVKQYDY